MGFGFVVAAGDVAALDLEYDFVVVAVVADNVVVAVDAVVAAAIVAADTLAVVAAAVDSGELVAVDCV